MIVRMFDVSMQNYRHRRIFQYHYMVNIFMLLLELLSSAIESLQIAQNKLLSNNLLLLTSK